MLDICCILSDGINAPKQEGEAFALPSGSVHDCREYPFCTLFVWRKNEQCDTDANRCNDCSSFSTYLTTAENNVLLMGANQRMMRWSQLVGKEQIAPNTQRTKMARRTVCHAFLFDVRFDAEQSIPGIRTVRKETRRPPWCA